jgi:ribosomal protein S18 acetylase RimI-like enzyme
MKILFEPEERYLLQIGNWLHQEAKEGKSNFYGNFANMKFTNDNFVCFVNALDEAIGFIKFSFKDKYTHIDLAVVRHQQQRKGIGKMLLDALTEKVRQKGTVALSLECAPKSSAAKWKKLGFKNFKEVMSHSSLEESEAERPWLYKMIVPAKQTSRKKALQNYIQLWTEPNHLASSTKMASTYIWDSTTLDLPIIYPVDDDWKIMYVKQGITVYEGRSKYFNQNSCGNGYFLVVEHIT